MEGQNNCWLKQLVLIVAVALLVLSPGPARGQGRSSYPGLERQTLVKELGLTPEQAKAFQAVGDKCDQSRDKIAAEFKSKESELEKALAAPKPDEMKIKELVAAIIQGHDQLLQTVKAQRQEEMALLTPIQQGKFILALKKWHEEMKEKPEK
jgi:Spy/CpxP family protein refolding chaperone